MHQHSHQSNIIDKHSKDFPLFIEFFRSQKVPPFLTDLPKKEEYSGHVRRLMGGKLIGAIQKALRFLVISTHQKKRGSRTDKWHDLRLKSFACHSSIQGIKYECNLLFKEFIFLRVLRNILLHVNQQPQHDYVFSLLIQMQMSIVRNNLVQSVAIYTLVLQQSCIDEFIQFVGGTSRHGKRRLFRKTLRFWRKHRKRIQRLACRWCQ